MILYHDVAIVVPHVQAPHHRGDRQSFKNEVTAWMGENIKGHWWSMGEPSFCKARHDSTKEALFYWYLIFDNMDDAALAKMFWG